MFITYQMVLDKNACTVQSLKFLKTFPDGVEVTEELCLKYSQDFDFEWAAHALLPYSQWSKFMRIVKEANDILWSARLEARGTMNASQYSVDYEDYDQMMDRAQCYRNVVLAAEFFQQVSKLDATGKIGG
jgi:hypothetical protein